MSAQSANEPSVKCWGAQIPYMQPAPASHIHLQLFNILPGEWAYPAHAAELATPRILTPLLDFPIWRCETTNFTWDFRHYFKPHIYLGTPYPPCEYIAVQWRGAPRNAFFWAPVVGVVRPTINEIKVYADNVAYGGTCTFSYQDK